VLGYGYDFRRAFHKCGRSYETRWSQKIVTTGSVVAASDFAAVTDFGHLSSHSVGLVPDDEHQRLILGSVASVMFFGYDDESSFVEACTFLAGFHSLIILGITAPAMSATKSTPLAIGT
jgi:hypothetical protein